MQHLKMNYSVYIHIPFCTHRCAYCDFNTYAGQEAVIPAYVEAMRREIEIVGTTAPEPTRVRSVFFGGGTPSLLSPEQFNVILGAVRCHFDVAADAEITTEANPGTVSARQLAELRAMGFNRISFGAQSANGEELRMLERTHTFLDVMEAVSFARTAGFDNLNLDLIYGLPEQTLETWQTTVGRVLAMQPEHISAYALTLEHGTPFGRWSARGLLPTPDPDAAAEMYEWLSETLEAAGYEQYEISNWARSVETSRSRIKGRTPTATEQPPFACRHNLQYWRSEPYLAFGAGAHGYACGYRYFNVLRIATYIERLKEEVFQGRDSGVVDRQSERQRVRFPLSPATVNQHLQTAEDEMSDFMITGLRLTREGIAARTFEHRFGGALRDVYGKQIDELTALGLLEWARVQGAGNGEAVEVLRITKRGRLLGNQAFMRFV